MVRTVPVALRTADLVSLAYRIDLILPNGSDVSHIGLSMAGQ